MTTSQHNVMMYVTDYQAIMKQIGDTLYAHSAVWRPMDYMTLRITRVYILAS